MTGMRLVHCVALQVMAGVWLPVLNAQAQAAASATADPVHIIKAAQGDTLIGLGKRYLAEPRRWPEMARASGLRNANRLAVGEQISIPVRLMRMESVPASVVSVTGTASTDASTSLSAGQPVAEGSEVVTGPDGHVTIRLVDGTVLRLRPESRLQLRESSRVRETDVVRSGTRLKRGRVEVEAAPARAGRPGFTIDTPQGVLGVRGTEFRVAVDGEGSDPPVTRGEVLGGAVAFSGTGGKPGERVAAGFGTRIDRTGTVAPPVRLLPMPDLQALPQLQERLLMRFVLPATPGAVGYRGQISRDAKFDQVIADISSAEPVLRFSGLPDGNYVLRVRSVDTAGLEGLDAEHGFRLKARPEAPLPSAPAPRARLSGTGAELAWAGNPEAQSYKLRLSRSEDFKTVVRDALSVRGTTTQVDDLQPGVYFWQLASVRGDSDQGPWGDTSSFELRPLPPAASPPKVSERAIALSWAALPGQTFDIEVARDGGFTQMVRQLTTAAPGIELALPMPEPSSGRFYVRVRARDADGYIGPFGTAQFFEIQDNNCWRDGSGECVRAGDKSLSRVQ